MNKEKGYVPPNEMPPRPNQRVLEGQKNWGTGTESGSREGGPTGFPTRSFRGDYNGRSDRYSFSNTETLYFLKLVSFVRMVKPFTVA